MLYQYPAIFTQQRPGSENRPIVATFAAPVGDLLEWTTVKRVSVGGAGHLCPHDTRRDEEEDDGERQPTGQRGHSNDSLSGHGGIKPQPISDAPGIPPVHEVATA